MSKQGEQVDVIERLRLMRAQYASPEFFMTIRCGELDVLLERVRLLEQALETDTKLFQGRWEAAEQREKGLREALERIIDFALRQRRRALAAECASPPTEESAKPSRPPFDATNRTSY